MNKFDTDFLNALRKRRADLRELKQKKAKKKSKKKYYLRMKGNK